MLKTQQNPTRTFLKIVLKRIFIVVKLVTYNFALSRALFLSVSRNLSAKWKKWADVHINGVHCLNVLNIVEEDDLKCST
jgi:hypothetical protein